MAMNLSDKSMESSENNKFIVKKFLFEDDFAIESEESNTSNYMGEDQPVVVDHHILDLEEKYKEGYEKGRNEEHLEQKSLAEQRLVGLLDQINNNLEVMNSGQKEIALAYEVMMMKILEQMVTKVFPELLKEKGFDELFGFVKAILTHEHKVTDFLLYVAPSEKGMLEQEINKIQMQGQKKITVIEEALLQEGECRLEFDETSIERSTQRIMDGVLKAIGRFKAVNQSDDHHEENATQEHEGDQGDSKVNDVDEEGGTHVRQ